MDGYAPCPSCQKTLGQSFAVESEREGGLRVGYRCPTCLWEWEAQRDVPVRPAFDVPPKPFEQPIDDANRLVRDVMARRFSN